MKFIIHITFLLFCCVCSGGPITIFNIDGRSIEVYPNTLLNGTFTFTKDAVNHTIEMSQLTRESQLDVTDYFDSRATFGEIRKLDRIEEIQELVFSSDQSVLERIKFSDPIDDFMPIHPYSEMDIKSIMISYGRAKSIIITVEFAKPIPEEPEFEQPYRIWVKLDLDDDSETGLKASGSIGEDIAVAINGWGEGQKWDYYTVPKSERGKRAKVEIDEIDYFGQTLSFKLMCSEFHTDEVFSVAASACANGGHSVDKAPNKSVSIPFSFRANLIKMRLRGR